MNAHAHADQFAVLHKQIRPSKLNPREFFDDAKLHELKLNVVENGIIEPLVVRADGAGFEIIAGERRWRAIGLAIKEGLWPADRAVPVTRRDANDRQAVELALSENVQRESMHPLEEGKAFLKLRGPQVRRGKDSKPDPNAYTTERIAQIMGKSVKWVQDRIALAEGLAPKAQDKFVKGDMTLAVAKTLARAPVVDQERLLKHVRVDSEPKRVAYELERKMLPVAGAIFDRAAYKGAMLADDSGKETHFADGKEAAALQRAAISSMVAALKKDGWKFVEIVKHFHDWQHGKSTDKAKAGVFVQVDQETLAVTIYKGWTKEDPRDAIRSTGKAKSAAKPADPLTKKHREWAHLQRTVALQNAVKRGTHHAMIAVIVGFFDKSWHGGVLRLRSELGQLNRHDDLDKAIIDALAVPLAKGWLRATDSLKRNPHQWAGDIKIVDAAALIAWLYDPKHRTIPALFAAMVARHCGSWAGFEPSYGATDVVRALAERTGATCAGWTMTGEYLEMSGDRTALLRIAQACIPKADLTVAPAKRKDLIAWIIAHKDRLQSWLPPELHFADDKFVRSKVSVKVAAPSATTAKRKPAAKAKTAAKPKTKAKNARKPAGKK